MTRIYGILAHPVTHSLSPAIHNTAFQNLKIDAKYEKFDVAPENLKKFIKKVKTEKISGLSVSIPHKENILKLLDEISDDVKKIGACNTILNKNDKLIGFNTDYLGFLKALQTKITNLKNKKVIVFGAGGASRAICYGLKLKKAKVFVTDIEIEKAQKLAKDFQINAINLKNIDEENFDIVVNATPLGMEGKFENLSACCANFFKKTQIVMDIVYKPLMTKFLKDAKTTGCEIITGEKMLLYQAIEQFGIWTEEKAPVKVMKKALEKN